TGMVRWTPSSTGTFSVTLKADDGFGNFDTQTYTITVGTGGIISGNVYNDQQTWQKTWTFANSGDPLPEWSSNKTDKTLSAAHLPFLGQFSNQVVTLSLPSLPAHEQATISFDLYLIRSWDGNTPATAVGQDNGNGAYGPIGPDIFDF